MRQLTHPIAMWRVYSIRLVALISIFALSQACSKNNEVLDADGKANIRIQVSTASESGGSALKASASRSGSEPGTQVFEIPFGDDMTITATLQEVGSAHHPAATNGKKAAVEQTDLDPDIKYTLLIYNSAGTLVDIRAYDHGQEDAVQGLKLTPGNYTFVAYSINSTANQPSLLNTTIGTSTLSQLENALTGEDLMFFKLTNHPIQAGNNTINIVLKHQFSQITTTLNVQQGLAADIWDGRIHSMGNAYFVSQTGGRVHAVDGSRTWSGTTHHKPVGFPAVGSNTKTLSATTLLLHPGTGGANQATSTGGILRIEDLKINDVIRTLELTDLRVNPGFKYNLTLTLNAPCIEHVQEQFLAGTINYNNSPLHQWTNVAGADWGFVFDIYRLDNSFKMHVNSTPLIDTRIKVRNGTQTRTRSTPTGSWATGAISWDGNSGDWNNVAWSGWGPGEIEFERSGGGSDGPITHNIEFLDGGRHGDGTIPQIYSETTWGTPVATVPHWNWLPIIQVSVQPGQVVSITGRKSATDPVQYPMRFITDVQTTAAAYGSWPDNTQLTQTRTVRQRQFETRLRTDVNWNPQNINNVTVSQNIVNVTYLGFNGRGLKKKKCTNPNP